MKNKGAASGIIVLTAVIGFSMTGLISCVSTPTSSIVLSANYQEYQNQAIGNERVIDTVGIRGNPSFECKDPQHQVTPQQALGITYQVRQRNENAVAEIFTVSSAVIGSPDERHRHETFFDQLLEEAKRQYPSENITIRNARTGRHIPTNPRQEEYEEIERDSSGNQYVVTRHRTVWDCFPFYVAEIITTDPMPSPVTHSEEFTTTTTRNDTYRAARNWIDDNTQSRRITISSEDFDRGRITGTVRCAARVDQTYIITSVYTIDVLDAKVTIRFDEPVLQRSDPAQQRLGRPEKIFLQSIADATRAELVDFSTTLRSFIVSR